METIGYSCGYSSALRDLLDWIEYHSVDLSQMRAFNQRGIIALLKAMAEKPEHLRQLGREAKLKATITSAKGKRNYAFEAEDTP